MHKEFLVLISAAIWLQCCLPANFETKPIEANPTKITADKSESEIDNNKNASSLETLQNAQTRIVKATDLLKLQLLEAAEKEKSSKESDLPGSHISNRTLRRGTTPTDNSPVVGNITQETITSSPQNKTKTQQQSMATTKSIKKDNPMVAEGVSMIVANGTQTENKSWLVRKQAAIIKGLEVKNNITMDNSTSLQNTQTNVTGGINSSSSNTTASTIKPTTTTKAKNTTKNTTTKAKTSTTTTTTSTTTTTTTTTTPKPKKPLVTYGLEDISEAELQKAATAAAAKLPPLPETAPVREPNAEPSQEMPVGYHRNREYMVPVLTIIFTLPLAIGVIIVSFRRFRDYWSTRHYRRMDFLVDGMYNE